MAEIKVLYIPDINKRWEKESFTTEERKLKSKLTKRSIDMYKDYDRWAVVHGA